MLLEELITGDQVISLFNKAEYFRSEKHLQDFVEENMALVCRDLFADELLRYDRESYMEFKRFGANKSRVDFLVEGRKGNYLVECKKPKNTQRELNRCLTQILDYIIIAERNCIEIKESWLITSKYHNTLHQIILRFKLPINVCVINNEKQAIFRYDI